jgi:hypothetical protein
MSTERLYVQGPNARPAIGQKAHSSREFATLGNFRARIFEASSWNGLTLGGSGEPVYRIVPHAGITIPETEQ